MERWREHPGVRVTIVLLAGSFALLAVGTAGVAASPWLVVALLAVAVLARELGQAARDTALDEVDAHRFVADLWIGFVVAAVVLVAVLDASPGEVQALGGLLGLVAMANYFMRPVYHLLYRFASRLADA